MEHHTGVAGPCDRNTTAHLSTSSDLSRAYKDRPRRVDLLCTSLLGLMRILVLEIDKIACFISWTVPSDRYLDRPWTIRSSFWFD